MIPTMTSAEEDVLKATIADEGNIRGADHTW